jgi:hypothetical protein
VHSVREIPQLDETLSFLCEETQNIYINSLPSLWDQRWEQERGERDKLNVGAKTKTLKLARKSYGQEQNMRCKQTTMLKKKYNTLYFFLCYASCAVNDVPAEPATRTAASRRRVTAVST